MLAATSAEVSERRYFSEKPTVAEVQALAAMLPGGVTDLVSTKSRRYKELGLAEKTLSAAEWAELLAREPGLWRRPLAISGQQLVVGYNAAALQELANA